MTSQYEWLKQQMHDLSLLVFNDFSVWMTQAANAWPLSTCFKLLLSVNDTSSKCMTCLYLFLMTSQYEWLKQQMHELSLLVLNDFSVWMTQAANAWPVFTCFILLLCMNDSSSKCMTCLYLFLMTSKYEWLKQ